jgi:hypothetical protein
LPASHCACTTGKSCPVGTFWPGAKRSRSESRIFSTTGRCRTGMLTASMDVSKDECLNHNWLSTLANAKNRINDGVQNITTSAPHSSLLTAPRKSSRTCAQSSPRDGTGHPAQRFVHVCGSWRTLAGSVPFCRAGGRDGLRPGDGLRPDGEKWLNERSF